MEIPVLPGYLRAFELKSVDGLGHRDGSRHFARSDGIRIVFRVARRNGNRAGIDHANDLLFFGIPNDDKTLDGMRAPIHKTSALRAIDALQTAALFFGGSEITGRAAVAADGFEIHDPTLA